MGETGASAFHRASGTPGRLVELQAAKQATMASALAPRHRVLNVAVPGDVTPEPYLASSPVLPQVLVRRGYDRLMDVAALSNVSLADSSGVSHRLGDLWNEKPVVLVFLRHFG
jgi:hypothetical protein